MRQNKKLSPKSILLFQIYYLIAMLFCGLLCGAIAVFCFILSIALQVLAFCSYFYLIFFYARQKYKNTEYYLGKDSLNINKGVQNKKKIKIIKSQVQYVESSANPLQRLLKLYTLTLHMAGSKIRLGPLCAESAKEITEWQSKDSN